MSPWWPPGDCFYFMPIGLGSCLYLNFPHTSLSGFHQWVTVDDTAASGGRSLQAMVDNGTNYNTGYESLSPRLDYKINFTQTGTHYVWILGKAGGSSVWSSNSIHAGLNGQGLTTSDRISGFDDTYGWSNDTMDSVRATIEVTETGIQTFNLWMREDGFIVDKILLITDPYYNPANWSMILSTPVWIIINWKYHPWRPPLFLQLDKWKEVSRFGSNLFGINLLDKLRANLDYLIVGAFLGIDELGIYYFAFNAGFGISRNVISIFSSALFPYLCQVRTDLVQLKKRYFNSLKKSFIVIISFIMLQSTLAPFYVPIVFGKQWTSAIPILILVCLSVIPYALFIFTAELMNTIGKPHLTLYWNVGYTFFFIITLLISVQSGVLWVALSVLITQLLIAPTFSIWSNNLVFNSSTKVTN